MKKTVLLFLLSLPIITSGQSMVYKPLNPAFGGDTFNYNWLLSSAQAQDKTKDPNAPSSVSSLRNTDPLQNFESAISSQLLNSLARNLYGRQFGEDGLQEGVYQFGNLTVDVRPGTEGLIIRITDGKGGETMLTVPYF